MFDVENLLRLGLFHQMIPIWQVFFYVLVLVPFLLLNRLRLCLFLTYLFTFYLGFMVQWGDYLANSGSMIPFVMYAFSGIAVAVLFVATFFSEEHFQIRIRRKTERETLQQFDPDKSE